MQPRWPQSTVLLIALSAVAGLILLDGSRAEALWDGHKLHAVCAQVRERQLGGDCAAYVRGVIDHFHEVLAARCPHQTVSFTRRSALARSWRRSSATWRTTRPRAISPPPRSSWRA